MQCFVANEIFDGLKFDRLNFDSPTRNHQKHQTFLKTKHLYYTVLILSYVRTSVFHIVCTIWQIFTYVKSTKSRHLRSDTAHRWPHTNTKLSPHLIGWIETKGASNIYVITSFTWFTLHSNITICMINSRDWHGQNGY